MSTLEATSKDNQMTTKMREFTVQLEDLFENVENQLITFLEDFKKMVQWMQQQEASYALKESSMKQQIIEKCNILRESALKNLNLLDSVYKSTRNEIATEDKKYGIKVSIKHDYQNQKDLTKEVKLPKEIVHLTKDIIKLVRKEEKLVEKDIKVEEKTQTLLEEFTTLTKKVKENVDELLGIISRGANLKDVIAHTTPLFDQVQKQIDSFKKLDKLEKLHLELLIKMNRKELEALDKEKDLDSKEAVYDFSKGYDTELDGTVLLDDKDAA